MIRVALAASSPIVRAGLETLLREDPRIALANGGGGAEVMVTEVATVEGLRRVLARQQGFLQGESTPIVLLADHLGRAQLRRALHSGVRAVLPREASGLEIIAAIEGAAAGLVVLSGEDLDALLPGDSDVAEGESGPGDELSSREMEVLAMLAEGQGNKDIAARLKISEHTVKFHVSSILGKLRATTRGEAVARGVREGLVVI